MRSFLELKQFRDKNLKERNLIFNMGSSSFQIYENGTELNISVSNSNGAVIKFEERQPDIFTVAVAYDEDCIIRYADAKRFKLSDKLTSLIDEFPNGYFIDNVVATLLSI